MKTKDEIIRRLMAAMVDVEACANGTAKDCRAGDDSYNIGMVIGAARKAIREAKDAGVAVD